MYKIYVLTSVINMCIRNFIFKSKEEAYQKMQEIYFDSLENEGNIEDKGLNEEFAYIISAKHDYAFQIDEFDLD